MQVVLSVIGAEGNVDLGVGVFGRRLPQHAGTDERLRTPLVHWMAR